MNIVLNGHSTTIDTPCTVHDLLAERDLANQPAAVEINGNVVPKARHNEHQITDGDRVEIVTLVGGG